MKKNTRATSPAVSTMLLIMVAVVSVAAAAAYSYQSGSISAATVEVTIDYVSFAKARSETSVWLFSMNLRNTGTVPVTISGSVAGTSLSQSISHDTIHPGSRGAISHVWTTGAVAGEKYIVDFVVTGSEGSTKRYVVSIVAEG